MAGKCYKCNHELSDPTVQFCPWCGAKFAARDSHYMADGRTITREDENAYLSSPPPKVKKSRAVYVAVAVIAVAAVLLILGASGASPTAKTADALYDYEFEDIRYYEGYSAVFYFAIQNEGADPINLDKVTVMMTIDGKTRHPTNPPSGWLQGGKAATYRLFYAIDESEMQYRLDLKVTSDAYHLERGTVEYWRFLPKRWG